MKQTALILPTRPTPAGSPYMAVDATAAHNAVVGQWTDGATNGPNLDRTRYHVEIRSPHGEPVQLFFDWAPPEEQLLHAIRRVLSWEGLRHWAAFLTLLSLKGGRRGLVRWTVPEHLDLMGYRKRTPDVRARSVEMMSRFCLTRLRAVKVDGDKKKTGDWIEKASNRPLVISYESTEKRRAGGPWEVDGMTLGINPLIYSGVRNPETHRVGRLWWPQSPKVARIDHRRYPYALALGLLLPMRWRWAINEGKDYAASTGRKLLRAAGIRYDERKPGRAWSRLHRNLGELVRRGALGQVDADGPPAGGTVYRLHPPADQLRIVEGSQPAERRPVDLPTTGEELRTWRHSQGLTQTALADALGVRRETVSRCERKTARPLSRRIAAGVRDVTFSALAWCKM